MNEWIALAVAATSVGQAVQIPGMQPPPHMHYEIVVTGVMVDPSKLNDAERLRKLCHIGNLLEEDVQKDKNLGIKLTIAAKAVRFFACAPKKSN